jgi:hypothetical protein
MARYTVYEKKMIGTHTPPFVRPICFKG